MKESILNSGSSLCAFNPKIIPTQWAALKLLRKDYDYRNGVAEVLLSGSVGSAKSLLLAHLAVTHCLQFPKARVLLGRKSMPDLKATIFQKILEHIYEDMVEGKDYEVNITQASIKFANGSEIISRSWGDKKFKKFRSLELSAAIIEELTENDESEKEFYTELIGRLGRVPSIASKECFVIAATNPDAPDHWAYDYFIKGSKEKENRFVFYSKTSDNPFLPSWYIESLMDKYDAKMIQRLIYGQWIYIGSDNIYYEYDRDTHLADVGQINPRTPIDISFDFNIGEGKPMSAVVCQFDGIYRVFDEVIIDGARTKDIMEEIVSRGYLDLGATIRIFGDSTGKSRDTRSIKSDYDIIRDFLSNYRNISFSLNVPMSNPPIRRRHNIVNGLLRNAKGHVKIKINKKCSTLDEGLQKVKLIKSGSYTEDDSKRYQHVTTALGYYLCKNEDLAKKTPSRTINL